MPLATILQIPATLMPRDTATALPDTTVASSSATGVVELFFGLILFAILVWLYVLPAWIAHRRKHHNADAITVINIFLGWTLLGWVLAMAWANTNPAKTTVQVVAAPTPSSTVGFCPNCGVARSAGKFCVSCGFKLET